MTENTKTPLFSRAVVRTLLVLAVLAAFAMAAGAPMCAYC